MSESEVCRVCHCEAEPERPLYHPCKCSGSIKFVHQDCLMTWLRVQADSSRGTSHNRCELCHETFHFRHVYADDAPALLGPVEFVHLLLPRARGALELAFRLTVFFLSWFVGLPLCTACAFKLCIRLNTHGVLAITDTHPSEGVLSLFQPLLLTWWLGVALSFILLLLTHVAIAVAHMLAREMRDVHAAATATATAAETDHVAGDALDGELDAGEDGAAVVVAHRGVDRMAALPPHLPLPLLLPGVVRPGDGADDDEALFGALVPSLIKCGEMLAFNSFLLFCGLCVPVLVGRTVMSVFTWVRGRVSWRDFVLTSGDDLEHLLDLHRRIGGSDELLLRVLIMGGEAVTGYVALSLLAAVGTAAYAVTHYDRRLAARASQLLWAWLSSTAEWNLRMLRFSAGVAVVFCALPGLLGWAIDLATLRVFDCTLGERMAMCGERVVFCAAVHWLVGFLFMLHVAAVVSEARTLLDVTRVGHVLPDFSADIADFARLIEMDDLDPNVAPQLAHRPAANMSSLQMVERTLLFALYSIIGVLLCVLLPVNVGHRLVPGAHMLRFQYDNTIFDIHVSMEMLFFHFVLPFALERLRHRSLTRLVLKTFLVRACAQCGLEDLLAAEEMLERRDALEVQALVAHEAAADQLSAGMDGAMARLEGLTERIEVQLGRLSFLLPADSEDGLVGFLSRMDHVPGSDADLADLDLVRVRQLFRLRKVLASTVRVRDVSRRVSSPVAVDPLALSLVFDSLNGLQADFDKFHLWAESINVDDMQTFAADPQRRPLDDEYLGQGEQAQTEDDSSEVPCDDDADVWRDVESVDEDCADGFNDMVQRIAGSRPVAALGETALQEILSLNRKLIELNLRLLDLIQATAPMGTGSEPGIMARVSMRQLLTALPAFVRVTVLMALGAVATVLFFSAAFYVPLTVGQASLRGLGLPASATHDLYSVVAGACLVWWATALCQHLAGVVAQSLGAADASMLLRTASRYLVIGLKVALVASVWLTAIPFLIGILFEMLFLVPSLSQYNETPFYPLLQSWAMGLVLLKMWAKGVLIGAVGGEEWRVKLERVMHLGIERIDVAFIFGEVITPIALQLLDQLLVPYFLGKLVGLFFADYLLKSCLMRFAYVAYLAFRLLCRMAAFVVRLIVRIHNEFRDARYLLGTELANR